MHSLRQVVASQKVWKKRGRGPSKRERRQPALVSLPRQPDAHMQTPIPQARPRQRLLTGRPTASPQPSRVRVLAERSLYKARQSSAAFRRGYAGARSGSQRSREGHGAASNAVLRLLADERVGKGDAHENRAGMSPGYAPASQRSMVWWQTRRYASIWRAPAPAWRRRRSCRRAAVARQRAQQQRE